MKNMAKITYENKVALNVNSDIADTNKCNASDLNEIKNVVNTNDDNTTTNTNDIANNATNIGTLSSLNTTNKSNLVNAINEVNNKFNYSTSEKVIGKWIDEKPIYSKIVTFEVDNNSDKFINYNIENVENIWIDESASYIMSDSETLPTNWYYSASDWCRTWANKNSGEIRFRSPSTLGARICYVCLKYTKTTD
jgi:hypothetical protein